MVKNIIKKYVRKLFLKFKIQSILKILISKVNWKSKVLLDNFHSYINLLLFNAFNLWKLVDNYDNEDFMNNINADSAEECPTENIDPEDDFDDDFDEPNVNLEQENFLSDDDQENNVYKFCKIINKKFLSTMKNTTPNPDFFNLYSKNLTSYDYFKKFMDDKNKSNKLDEDSLTEELPSSPEENYKGFVKEQVSILIKFISTVLL